MEWNQKHKAVEAVAFTALMALALGYGILRRHPGAIAADVRSSESDRTTRLYEAARQPLPIPNVVGRYCRALWETVRGFDLAEFVEYPPRPDLIPKVARCAPPSAELDRTQSEFAASCGPLAQWDSRRSQKDWRKESRKCTGSWIAYRASITAWLARGRQLAAIQDPLVLTDMLIASLGEDKADSVAVAERLLQLEPRMYPAAKAVLVGLISEAASRALGRGDDPIWEKIDVALRRAEGMSSGEQKQLLETELALGWMRYRDPQRSRQKAEALMFTHPELGAGPYYLAWAEYQAGDKEKAQADLAEAIRREPNERQFREAWEKFDFPNEQPFRTYLSFH